MDMAAQQAVSQLQSNSLLATTTAKCVSPFADAVLKVNQVTLQTGNVLQKKSSISYTNYYRLGKVCKNFFHECEQSVLMHTPDRTQGYAANLEAHPCLWYPQQQFHHSF